MQQLLFCFCKDLFIGLQEIVVGYSKASEQPQSSARPICHSHAMMRTGHKPANAQTFERIEHNTV